MKRYIVLAAAVVGLVLVSGASALTYTATRIVTVGAGTALRIPSLDFSCIVMPSDPNHREAGPILFCSRFSTMHSRGVIMSRAHIMVTDESGDWVTNVFDRSP